jgi:hypothetical protein
MSDEKNQKVESRMIITPEEFGKEIYEEVWREIVSPGITAANAPLREPRFNPPPRMLHYTSATGLEAILRTSILRLCRARASNDPMELEYGLDLARGIIREIQPANDVDHAFKRFIEAGTRDGTFGGRPPFR